MKSDIVSKLEHLKDNENDTLSSNTRMEKDTTNLVFFVEYTKCRRDAKLSYKMHISMLDKYLTSNSNWKQTTVKATCYNH